MAASSTLPRPHVFEHLRLAAQATDIAAALEHMHGRFGSVVDVGYRFPVRAVYGFGPAVNQHLLADDPANFRWKEAFSLLEVVDGPTSLLLSDGNEHRRRRRLVQPAFSVRRIDAHLDLVVAEIDRMLDGWRPGRTLVAHDEVRATVRRIVVRALFGEQLGALADTIGDRLEPALRYVQRTPLGRFDVNLRWNGYGRAVGAARAVDDLVLAEIARRRRDGVDADREPDVLSALLVAAGDGDEPLTDAEICDQIRSLIAAGYDTTSAAAAWLVHGLGVTHGAREALRTQVRDHLGSDPPSIESLRAMPLVDGVVRETLRLWPPAAISGRVAVDDFELLGHRIAGGTTVVYSPYITHRMAEVWDAPATFRPERWDAGEPVPYSFVPFGGGYRKCIGFALATLELQVLAVRVAQRVDWTSNRPDARGVGVATFAPKGGVPITIR